MRITIPKLILKNIDKKDDNIFVFDRGVSSRAKFCEFAENGFLFVTRLKTDARHETLETQEIPENLKVGNLSILGFEKVYLKSDKGIIERVFRLLKTKNEKDEPLWFLSNGLDLSIKEVIYVYKRRWDIEVFFRFIKQELNFSHFLSTNINGIKVVLYMTLILAMLILTYKKINDLGYKTAKRRFYYEVDEIIMRLAIVLSGGNPELVFR